jgi:hypothetical protein
MVEGGYYVYQEKLYHCTRTGLFKGSYKTYDSPLYCSDTVYCSDALVCTDAYLEYGGSRLAEYDVVNLIEEGVPIHGVTETFVSTRTDYDWETHKKLGDYLRFINSQYGLNLMPLYNCFGEYYVDGVDLTTGRLREENVVGYRTALVPIKFNRRYTIAMNSKAPVYMMPIIFDGKLIRRVNDVGGFVGENEHNTVTKVNSFRYKHPVTLDVTNTDPELQPLEKNLYLALQVPANLDSKITVIEGQYASHNGIQIYDEKMFRCSPNKVIDSIMVSDLSLLNDTVSFEKNTHNVPFSDKLIGYLLRHTIDMRNPFTEDVEYVTNKFGYYSGFKGSWETELRCKLFDAYMLLKDTKSELNFTDVLGYVDADIETALDKGWLKHSSVRKFNKIKSGVK